MQEEKNSVQIIAGAVLFADGKILLLQRRQDEETYPSLWELPSGKKEPLESIENALQREIAEETGLHITDHSELLSVFEYRVGSAPEIKERVQLNYLISVSPNSEIILSSEHQKHAWVTEQELGRFEISPETLEVLRKAFKIISKNI